MNKTLYPLKNKLSGEIKVPSSKSHTIRALLIALLAEGKSCINNPLASSDTESCIETCKILGAEISKSTQGLVVEGLGTRITPSRNPIDVGNSGTTLYLAAAVAAVSPKPIQWTGDAQIQNRSAAPLLKSLEDLGAEVSEQAKSGCAPFTIRGPLKGGKTSISCPTSQYLSALLLACPLAEADSEIEVLELNEIPYVKMTLQWLKKQGIKLNHSDDFSHFSIQGRQKYKPAHSVIAGDYSSATFFLCAAAITGSNIIVKGLDKEDSQGDKAVLEMLSEMGCQYQWKTENNKSILEFCGPEAGSLRGASLNLNQTPDALPAIAVTAAYASGKTIIYGTAHARLKETDRIAVMETELRKLGVDITATNDGLVIQGGVKLQAGTVEGHGDHRIVMALSVGALAAEGPLTITTAEAVNITFPDFFEKLEVLSKT